MRPPLSIFACVACIIVVIAAAASTVAIVRCSLHAPNLLLSRSVFVFVILHVRQPPIHQSFVRSFVRSVASAAIVQTIVVVVYLVGKQKTKNGRNIVCKVIFVFHFGLLLLKWLRLALCFCHKGF